MRKMIRYLTAIATAGLVLLGCGGKKEVEQISQVDTTIDTAIQKETTESFQEKFDRTVDREFVKDVQALRETKNRPELRQRLGLYLAQNKQMIVSFRYATKRPIIIRYKNLLDSTKTDYINFEPFIAIPLKPKIKKELEDIVEPLTKTIKGNIIPAGNMAGTMGYSIRAPYEENKRITKELVYKIDDYLRSKEFEKDIDLKLSQSSQSHP